jgi:hypothetical protein
VRRLGTAPKDRPGAERSLDAYTCPDIFDLGSGLVAVIGAEMSPYWIPDGATLGPGERIVVIPRSVLVDAARDL